MILEFISNFQHQTIGPGRLYLSLQCLSPPGPQQSANSMGLLGPEVPKFTSVLNCSSGPQLTPDQKLLGLPGTLWSQTTPFPLSVSFTLPLSTLVPISANLHCLLSPYILLKTLESYLILPSLVQHHLHNAFCFLYYHQRSLFPSDFLVIFIISLVHACVSPYYFPYIWNTITRLIFWKTPLKLQTPTIQVYDYIPFC